MATEGDKVEKKVYSRLAFIGHGNEYKCQEVMSQLYSTLVRPHLRELRSVQVVPL